MLKAEAFMQEAILEAGKDSGEVPVGAVIVKNGKIIARAHNERESGRPFAHAEMLAMERACQALGERRLHGCELYVTLEPCPMCAGGMIMAEIDACYFGAYDERQGCCGSVYTLPEDPAFFHRVRCMGGILEQECQKLLQDFFRIRR
ncbi:MAG: nucleoside deaminase [Clostridiales bacterium]|nr:nucleoside deaminase [Clostridiales bacterium]